MKRIIRLETNLKIYLRGNEFKPLSSALPEALVSAIATPAGKSAGMRIHYLQHVPYEGPGAIDDWAVSRGFERSSTLLFEEQEPPAPGEVDLLVIMGGPMGVQDEAACPWLTGEKRFVEQVLSGRTKTVGICLGAQLLADVLGAPVYHCAEKEIGWFPVQWSADALESGLFEGTPTTQTVFHWHGDTFDLPDGAVPLASSRGCTNQGFLYGENTVGLQFHLEMTPESVRELVEHGEPELNEKGAFIQSKRKLLEEKRYFDGANRTMHRLLDRLTASPG